MKAHGSSGFWDVLKKLKGLTLSQRLAEVLDNEPDRPPQSTLTFHRSNEGVTCHFLQQIFPIPTIVLE
jgi:hypothetical protein